MLGTARLTGQSLGAVLLGLIFSVAGVGEADRLRAGGGAALSSAFSLLRSAALLSLSRLALSQRRVLRGAEQHLAPRRR